MRLVSSMTKKIYSNYIFYLTAKDLWDNVNQMHSDLDNQSQVLELNLKLGDIWQVGDIIHNIFTSWQKFSKT